MLPEESLTRITRCLRDAHLGRLTPDTSIEQQTREAAATFSIEGADPAEAELVSRAVVLSRQEKIPLEAAIVRLEKEGVH